MTVDWKVTATTLFCEDIGTDVTIMLYSDGTLKCTGAARAHFNNKGGQGCKSPGPCAMTECMQADLKSLKSTS